MNQVNLGDLLLQSIENKDPINFRKQLFVGKKCFIVDFTLNGKNLIIKDIYKRSNRRPTFEKRCFKRWRLLRQIYLRKQRNRVVEKSAQTSLKENLYLIQRMERGSQTRLVRTTTRSTRTQAIKRRYKNTQTEEIPGCYFSKACQTTNTSQSNSVGVQYEADAVAQETQTEPNVQNVECQTHVELFSDVAIQVKPKTETFEVQTEIDSTDGEQGANYVPEDQQTLVFMLNEIGEVNMNHLEISQQHIEISRTIFQLMVQLVNAQKLQHQIMQPIVRLEEFFQKRIFVSESTQTESNMQAKESQTMLKSPRRRWQIFKQLNSHKSESS